LSAQLEGEESEDDNFRQEGHRNLDLGFEH
jgi:hypothetical protein